MVNYREINAENFPASEWVSSSGVLTTTPLPYCDECEQGWISVEGEPGQARIAKRCPTCHPLRQKLKYLERARLPFVAHKHLLRDYEWDSPEQAERVGAVLDWLHGKSDPIDRPCVMMYGKPGNGKSYMLHVLGKHACFAGKRALFLTHEGYMLDLRASFNRDKRIDFHEMLERVDLLCLDELGGMGGGGHWSAWYKAQVLEMISAMYDRWSAKKLSIVMTSNLVPKQILDDLCERNTAAESRLAQMFGRPVRMVGPDRRASSSGNGWR
jgi:DNA replication protein DnaC